LDRFGDGKGFPVRQQTFGLGKPCDAFHIQKRRPQNPAAISFGLSQV
jgi:hypothetical protein